MLFARGVQCFTTLQARLERSRLTPLRLTQGAVPTAPRRRLREVVGCEVQEAQCTSPVQAPLLFRVVTSWLLSDHIILGIESHDITSLSTGMMSPPADKSTERPFIIDMLVAQLP